MFISLQCACILPCTLYSKPMCNFATLWAFNHCIGFSAAGTIARSQTRQPWTFFKCICSNCKMYLSKLSNVFQIQYSFEMCQQVSYPTNNVSCHCSAVNQAILCGPFESFSSSLASLNNFHSSTTSATVPTVTGVLLTMSIYLLCCQPIHLGWPASTLWYYSTATKYFFF